MLGNTEIKIKKAQKIPYQKNTRIMSGQYANVVHTVLRHL